MAAILREWFFKVWYWYISNIDKNAEVVFMNFGYTSPNQKPELKPEDEINRYSIQLYHLLAASVDLKDKSLLEIGCGRGGGLSYIAKYFPLKSALGVDLNKRATQFSQKHYQLKGLDFMQGDAQKLAIEDNRFDIVINVESSHRYPDMQAFLGEVKRVLKPGGHFLFTDFRYDYEMDELNKLVSGMGLKIVMEQNITSNVVAALKADDQRRRQLVKKLAPKILHKLALNFAGAVDSETYHYFASGKYEYFYFVLEKEL
jgi:ubiquinone/menaquinone biosynthesis C-methylase UbiE